MERTHIYIGFPMVYLWSYSFFCFQNWYAVAKTLAEEAAWKFAKENEMDLVTLHPGLVIGPPLQPSLKSSVHLILHQINGIFYESYTSYLTKYGAHC